MPKITEEDLKKRDELHAKLYPAGNEDVVDKDENNVDDVPEQQGEVAATEPVQSQSNQDGIGDNQIQNIDSDEYNKLLHKHKTLQGKYRAETTRAKRELEEYKSQFAEQQKRLDALEQIENQRKSAEAETKRIEDINPADYISAETIDEWGPEMMGVVAKMSHQIANKLVDEKLSSLDLDGFNSKLQQVEHSQGKTNEEVFFARLTSLVPDWERINSDEGFVAWLSEPDGLSGRTRYENAEDAFTRFDVSTAAKYFDAYKRSLSTAGQNLQSQPQQQKPSSADDISMTANVNIQPNGRQAPTQMPDSRHVTGRMPIEALREAERQWRGGRMSYEEFDKVRHEFAKSNRR